MSGIPTTGRNQDVVDWRRTFLRQHIRQVLSRARHLDILALDDLLDCLPRGLDPTDPRVFGLVNRRQFFYRNLPEERLYVPVLVRVAEGFTPHYTDEVTRQQRMSEDDQARKERWDHHLPFVPRCRDPSFTSYGELSDLIKSMHQRLNETALPDRRGVVLLSPSGAGNTVACWKAFYDCLYSTPRDVNGREKPNPSLSYLAGFLPCWVLLEGALEGADGIHWALVLLLRTAGLAKPNEIPGVDDGRIRLLSQWLRHGPRVLLFADLATVARQQDRLQLAKAFVWFQKAYGQHGHRCVVALRSTDSQPEALSVLSEHRYEWFGFYELQPLEAEVPDQYRGNLRTYRQEVEGTWGAAVQLPPNLEKRRLECSELAQRQRSGCRTWTPQRMHVWASLNLDEEGRVPGCASGSHGSGVRTHGASELQLASRIRFREIRPSTGTEAIETEARLVTIGRAPKNIICVADQEVSWEHGQITLRSDGYVFRHLSKLNPTVLRRRGQEYLLREGGMQEILLQNEDRLTVGSTTFVIEFNLQCEDGGYTTTAKQGDREEDQERNR
jgi:hypothetical protein